MDVIGDYHVHTGLSGDAEGSVEEYCEKAISQGLKEIGFCEHLDLWPSDPHYGMYDYDACLDQICKARDKFSEKLIIRMGVEVTYLPEQEAEIKGFLEGKQYDYIVGGVHIMQRGEMGVSDEFEALETFARNEVSEVYHIYFEHVESLVRSGLFDVVAHLDLVNRYGINYLKDKKFRYGEYYGELRRILEGMVKRQMALEVNTSGLRQRIESTYPGPEILRLYRELSGKMLILGSDAHKPDDLARDLDQAIIMANEAQLSRFVTYQNRIPVDLK